MAEQALSSSDTLALLRAHKPVLAERFGVSGLALFGSTVRDEAKPDSDIDILVSFTRPLGVEAVLRRLALHRGPARSADRLRHGQELRPELRPYVEAEAVHV